MGPLSIPVCIYLLESEIMFAWCFSCPPNEFQLLCQLLMLTCGGKGRLSMAQLMSTRPEMRGRVIGDVFCLNIQTVGD